MPWKLGYAKFILFVLKILAGALFDLGEITQTFGKEFEAEKCFESACRQYELAEKVDPDDDTLLNDWGRALYERAKMKEGDESEALLIQSAEKFERAYTVVRSHEQCT